MQHSAEMILNLSQDFKKYCSHTGIMPILQLNTRQQIFLVRGGFQIYKVSVMNGKHA